MTDVMIEARDLTKSYGPVFALKDVSFEVRKGEVLGFLGPNGAGKTTTMKILTCFIAPSSGTASVNGADVFEDPMAVRTSIGYLPESTPLYTEMLTYEYLEFAANMRGFKGGDVKKRIKKAVEQTSLEDVIAKEIGQLSKGYRQRVGLAQALIHEPPILILDEPMSGLDPNQAAEIRELITEIGKERTVILSTHDLAEVQVTCGRVLIVAKGRIVADDTPDELRERTGGALFKVTAQVGASGYRDGEADSAGRIRELLGKVEGVDSVKARDGDEGEAVFLIRPSKKNGDLRAEIFKAAVDGKFVMLGLEKQSEGLDKVFRDLTTGDTGAVADSREAKIEEARAKKKVRDEARAASDSDEDSDSGEEPADADEDSNSDSDSGENN